MQWRVTNITVRTERDDDTVDETGRKGRGSKTAAAGFVGVMAVIALVLLLALLFGGIDVDVITVLGEPDDVEVEDLGVSADDVIEEPEQYLGQVITVNGTVDEIVGPRSITVNSDGAVGESLLVVGTEDIAFPPGAEREETDWEDSFVQDTCRVHMFDDDMLDDAGDAYGFMFEEDVFSQYEGEPVILVDEVDISSTEP